MRGTFSGLRKNLKYIQCRYLNSLVPRDRIKYKYFHILPTERNFNRRDWVASGKKKFPKKSTYIDKNLHIHVSLQNDPLKLANYILRLLNDDRFHQAVQIVRNISRSIQCVVSWNHMIDWLMSKGRMNAAFKIYHEMKKRANIPDAHTYTILFRGCAKSLQPKQALANAIAVYQSMLLDKSPVKPNIIHVNAILKLCAIAGDLDSMLNFVKDLPSSGARAGTSATFTTVLNALRYSAVSRTPTPLTDEQRKQRIQKMVLQAQQIWRDIIKLWRRGDMWIDEELVCSMGHILLTSKDKRHWNQILTIIEQTMGIPRQLTLFNPHSKDLVDPDHQHQNESMPLHDISFDPNLETRLIPGSDLTPGLNFSSKLKNYSPSVMLETSKFAKPGRNSLSLVLKAILLLSIKEPATEYWRIFTEQYNIQPDLENYVSYLRILRIFRASTETLNLLSSMPPQFMVPQVFRIAISSSFRDKNNHHAFSNAGKMLDLMQISLKEPDVPTILRYLELAMLSPSRSKKPSIVDTTNLNGALGSQILRALDRVQQLLLEIKSYIFFRDMGLTLQSDRHEFLVNVEKLIRKSIQAHTFLQKQRIVPDNLFPELKARSIVLSHLISRLAKYRRSVGGSSSKTYGPET